MGWNTYLIDHTNKVAVDCGKTREDEVVESATTYESLLSLVSACDYDMYKPIKEYDGQDILAVMAFSRLGAHVADMRFRLGVEYYISHKENKIEFKTDDYPQEYTEI